MSAGKIGLLLATAVAIGGCGSLVPEIEEFWATPGDASIKVNKISGQVVCELRRAVQQVFLDERNHYVEVVADPHHPPRHFGLKWFEQWGVQVTLTLTIVENTAVAPTVTFINPFTTPSTSFSTSLSGSLSGTATRTDILNMFYSVHDLEYGTPSLDKTCIPAPTNGDLFVQSDLKLYQWLSAALLPNITGIVDYEHGPTDKNAISHEVKFEIVSNGSVTPTWTLVRVTANANTTGNLFSTSRDRTQDLSITFGPTLGPTGAKQLATPAQNSHLATQIGLAVSQALKTTP
jgi:hypothetical protein